MIEQKTRYGMSTTVSLPYELAAERARQAIAAEGFGILAEMDIAATLKKKLNVDFRPYVILGACMCTRRSIANCTAPASVDAIGSPRRLRVLPRERRANDGRNETRVEDAGEQRYEADHHQDDTGRLLVHGPSPRDEGETGDDAQ